MRLTTNHSSSSYGIPVFLDGEGNPMDYAPALRQLRKEKGWSVEYLANECGVSPRTVEGWEQGRMPSVPALKILSKII
jgi:DNA-binding transcriptional regulator YiaG